jgi:hypothetical protein
MTARPPEPNHRNTTRLQHAPGAVAAVMWLLAGAHAIATLPGPPFLSNAVFYYLLTGIFLAPFVFGLPVFALQKAMAQQARPAREQMLITVALLLGEAVLVTLAARGAYLRFVATAFTASAPPS